MSINKIREIAFNKRAELEKQGEDLKKITSVISLLSDDMCFFKININMAIPILLYLGISEQDVKDVYFQLIDASNFVKEPIVRKIIGK